MSTIIKILIINRIHTHTHIHTEVTIKIGVLSNLLLQRNIS